MNQKEFKQSNHDVLAEFVEQTKPNDDELSDTIKCIISQFLLNVRRSVRTASKSKGWISSLELIDIQQTELRRCIIDLETQKNFLTKGVTKQ